MKENDGVVVRVLSDETIQSIVSTQPLRTSRQLTWPGVEVHRYRLTGPPEPAYSLPFIGVFLPHVEEPYRSEMTIGGKVITALMDNTKVSIVPAGLMRKVLRNREAPVEVTAIFLDPLAVTHIARAQTGVDFPEIIPQFGISDPLIRSIGMMLDAELSAERPSPRIYAESLVSALAAQIFAKYTRPVANENYRRCTQSPQLRRSIEFINQNLDKNLSLGDVAAIAHMSKYHFAKSFREAIGIPPHQYLVKMRMEKARKLLKDHTMSLEEVAWGVGYADKGHFANQFLRIVGTTPKRYREAT